MTQTKSDEANLNEKSSGSSSTGRNVSVKQCQLRRKRFVNENFIPSKSAIGGGINFRESHVPKKQQVSRISKTLMSRIKANSLSDIESIDSQEEETSKSQVVGEEPPSSGEEQEEEESSEESNRYSVAGLNSQAFGKKSMALS